MRDPRNNGEKFYTKLRKYYLDTGEPILDDNGNYIEKPNVEGTEGYISKIVKDEFLCPIEGKEYTQYDGWVGFEAECIEPVTSPDPNPEPTPDSYQHVVDFALTSTAACSGISKTSKKVYSDTSNFKNSSNLYSDSRLSNVVSSGYYALNSYYIEINGNGISSRGFCDKNIGGGDEFISAR